MQLVNHRGANFLQKKYGFINGARDAYCLTVESYLRNKDKRERKYTIGSERT